MAILNNQRVILKKMRNNGDAMWYVDTMRIMADGDLILSYQ